MVSCTRNTGRASFQTRAYIMSVASFLAILTLSSFKGFGQIPDTVPRTEAGLNPETRARYVKARSDARQAEEAHAQSIRDADAADLALAFAREMLVRSREESQSCRGSISVIEQRCEALGPNEVEKFRAWQRCKERPFIRDRVREVAAMGLGARKMLAWMARSLLGLMARQPNLPDRERKLLPLHPEATSDDEALTLLDRYMEMQIEKENCELIQPSIALDKADLDVIRRAARAESDLFVSNEYVSIMTPDSVRQASKRWTEALNRTSQIWPRWIEYEKQQAAGTDQGQKPPTELH